MFICVSQTLHHVLSYSMVHAQPISLKPFHSTRLTLETVRVQGWRKPTGMQRTYSIRAPRQRGRHHKIRI